VFFSLFFPHTKLLTDLVEFLYTVYTCQRFHLQISWAD